MTSAKARRSGAPRTPLGVLFSEIKKPAYACRPVLKEFRSCERFVQPVFRLGATAEHHPSQAEHAGDECEG